MYDDILHTLLDKMHAAFLSFVRQTWAPEVIARLDAKASGAEEKEYRIERKVDRWQRRVVAVGEADDGE